MNAREFTLINYFYAILKVLAGFTLCSFVFGLSMGLSVWQCILIPFFVAGAKLAVAAHELWDYEKKGTVTNENKLSKFSWIAAALLLAAAYGLPAVGILIPEVVSDIIMCSAVVLGLLSIRKILTFPHYKPMYKELLAGVTMQMDPSARTKLQQQQSFKTISADTSITSNKKGFEYLNELFIKRHQKILWKSVRRITSVALAVIAVVLLRFYLAPEAKDEVNGMEYPTEAANSST